MLKLFCINLFVLLCGASVIHVPLKKQNVLEPTRDLEQIQEKWTPHLIDFFNLVDTNKLITVAMQHINDPDVVDFINFIVSSEFKEVALKFEAIEEFKEAVDYLENKGHDVKSILVFLNSILELESNKKHDFVPSAKNENQKGMTKLIGDILRALPVDEWKKLFEEKLETSSDVRVLFETLTAEEFEDIMKRFAANPQLIEIKRVFEDHGLDFDELNILVNEIFGDFIVRLVRS